MMRSAVKRSVPRFGPHLTVLVLLFLVGCSSSEAPTTARVSIFHAGLGADSFEFDPDYSLTVDVYLDGELQQPELAYADATAPLALSPGTHTVRFTKPGEATSLLAEATVNAEAGKTYVVGLIGVAVASSPLPLEAVALERPAGVSVFNALPLSTYTLNLFFSPAEPAQPFVTPDVANVAYGQNEVLPQNASNPLLRVQTAEDGVPYDVVYRTESLARYSDALFVVLGNPDLSKESALTGRVLNASGTWASLESSALAEYPDMLRQVDLQVVSNATCTSAIGPDSPLGFPITDTMLCAGSPVVEEPKDTCQGDSGGPLVAQEGTYVQVGVTSFGSGCGQPQRPGVYTRVGSYVGWIAEQTGIPVASLTSAPLEAQIIGGEDAVVNDYPWMAGLLYGDEEEQFQVCGASVIASGWIMTAAHCVVDYDDNNELVEDNPSFYRVLTGSTSATNVGGDGEVLGVAEIIAHPDYFTEDTGEGDIALLRLSDETTQTPVTLPPADDAALTAEGRTVTAVGWGSILEY